MRREWKEDSTEEKGGGGKGWIKEEIGEGGRWGYRRERGKGVDIKWGGEVDGVGRQGVAYIEGCRRRGEGVGKEAGLKGEIYGGRRKGVEET